MIIKTSLEQYRNFLPIADLKSLEVDLYLKIYLYKAFVFEFDFQKHTEIEVGTKLELVKTMDAKYGAYSVYLDDQKLSSVSSEFSGVLTAILDAELLEIHAEITHFNPSAHTYERLQYAVFTYKKIHADTDLDKLEKLAAVCKPNYYTLPTEFDEITKKNYLELKSKQNNQYFYSKLHIELFNAYFTVLLHSYSSVEELEIHVDLDAEIVFEELPADIPKNDVFNELFYYKAGTKQDIDLNQNYIFAINIHFLRSSFFSPKHIYETIGKNGQKYYDVVYGK